MTCIVINECNHGILGIAANYKSAINFLIAEDWLSDYTDIYSKEKDEWITLIEWHSNWKEYLLSHDMDDFNVLFEDTFYLEDHDIFNIEIRKE